MTKMIGSENIVFYRPPFPMNTNDITSRCAGVCTGECGGGRGDIETSEADARMKYFYDLPPSYRAVGRTELDTVSGIGKVERVDIDDLSNFERGENEHRL